MKKITDFIMVIINEFLSYFVPERVSYEITGECKKCGKCCNYMYSIDTYTEKEFKIMQTIFPKYKRFYIKGKDEDGNLISEDGSVANSSAPYVNSYPFAYAKNVAAGETVSMPVPGAAMDGYIPFIIWGEDTGIIPEVPEGSSLKISNVKYLDTPVTYGENEGDGSY